MAEAMPFLKRAESGIFPQPVKPCPFKSVYETSSKEGLIKLCESPSAAKPCTF